jgi:hypothetical protein
VIILSDNKLLLVLSRQFNHSWALLSQAINNISDDRWGQVLTHDHDNYWVFSLTVYHILETSEFYIRNSPDGMEWGKKGQIDWDSDFPIEKKIIYLTKSLIKQYLEEIKSDLEIMFSSTLNNQLFNTDGFSWFPSVLDKYLYLLRHNMMHIGELNKALREWKYPRINWE